MIIKSLIWSLRRFPPTKYFSYLNASIYNKSRYKHFYIFINYIQNVGIYIGKHTNKKELRHKVTCQELVKELGNCLLYFQCSQTGASLDTYFLRVFSVPGSYFETDITTHTLWKIPEGGLTDKRGNRELPNWLEMAISFWGSRHPPCIASWQDMEWQRATSNRHCQILYTWV